MRGYFDYLCREVGIGGPEGRPYRRLASFLLEKPFTSNMAGDLNREADGVDLRKGYSDAPMGEARVLEVLVALCRKMAYMADGMMPDGSSGKDEWFYQMIQNLGLVCLTDERWNRAAHDAEDIANEQVTRWLERDYEYDGTGGIFPLSYSHDDQANVELWYQMNAYLMEHIGDIS